jgi:UDP-glucose 4-epimerase
MKILITGSTGLLGNLITKSLLVKRIKVIGLDLKEPMELYPEEIFSFYKCSITDRERIKKIFAEECPTHVIHLASTLGKLRDKKSEYEIDVEGSKNILACSNKTTTVKQLIYTSSALAYGGNKENPPMIDESCELNPGDYTYGKNKKTVEQIFSDTSIRNDLNLNLLRICNVVGPSFNKPGSVVSLLLNWSWLPEFCKETKIQFLHEEDFVSVINLILFDKRINGVFNIAPDKYAVVKDLIPHKKYFRIPVALAKGILTVLWKLKLINFQPAGIYCAIYPILLDPGKVRSTLDFEFKYSTREAFEDTRRTNKIPAGTFI